MRGVFYVLPALFQSMCLVCYKSYLVVESNLIYR